MTQTGGISRLEFSQGESFLQEGFKFQRRLITYFPAILVFISHFNASQHDSHEKNPHCQDGSSHQPPASPQEPSRSTEISPQMLKFPCHGRWLPGDVGLIQKWVHHMIQHVDALPPRHPGLPKVIESDPALYVVFITTFKEYPPSTKTPLVVTSQRC
jgi:hypothetical protein